MYKKFYRIKELQAEFGIGRSTIYDLIQKNEFPKSIRIGGAAVFVGEEIKDMVEKKKAEREGMAND